MQTVQNMQNMQKKSFLMYFDNYACLSALSDVQRGKLLLLLYQYAMEADRHSLEPESFLQNGPELPPETRMAFLFVAQSIRRDTDRWRAKQQRYSAAARRRTEEQAATLAAQRDAQGEAEMEHYLRQFRAERIAARARAREGGPQEGDR